MVPTTSYKKNVGLGRILRDSIFAFRTYQKGIKLPRPDCIFYSESPLNFGYAGFMLARNHKCPVIFHQMDLWPELMENLFPCRLRLLSKIIFAPFYCSRRYVYKRLNAVTALARTYLEVPLKEAPILASRPNALIYNGIDVKKFRESLVKTEKFIKLIPARKNGELRAIFAGSLGPSYDIKTLLNVTELLFNKGSKLKIIIAGDGPLKSMVEDYAFHHPNYPLIFLGKLNPEDLRSLYALCDIGLCSYSNKSNVEMPDKIYDYTAAGFAVINSLNGEVSSLIKKFKFGLQYSPGDCNDLFKKLQMLERNPSLLKKMTSNSYDIGMKFDVHIQNKKLINLFQEVVLGAKLKC